MSSLAVLLRHGHVAGIDPPHFRGRDDLPLSALGHSQARATGDHLGRMFRVESVLSSPLSRCRITAATAWPAIDPLVLPDLTDLDYGTWQGRSHEAVRAEQPEAYEAWHMTPDRSPAPGGETLQQGASRASRILDLLASRRSGECTLVVSHNSTIRLLTLLALGLPISRYWHVRQDPCGLSVLERDDRGWCVRSLNETAQLAKLTDGSVEAGASEAKDT